MQLRRADKTVAGERIMLLVVDYDSVRCLQGLDTRIWETSAKGEEFIFLDFEICWEN